MERLLQFRAWDIKRKNMFNVAGITFYNDKTVLFSESCNLANSSLYGNEFELMQYTGMIDYNGKMIYEDDILQCVFSEGGSRILKVAYIKPSFCWLPKYDWNDKFENQSWNPLDQNHINKWQYKIIGNIWQNPELLEVEDDK
jgi:uncharacterized phage protein (TIGR01671 family)